MDELNSELVFDETMRNLLQYIIYTKLVKYGRKQTFEDVKKIIKYLDYHNERLIKETYEFVCDLYDDNEANGYNDQMYPYRA